MKTTKKDFKIFRRECKKWIKRFGLTGWEFNFIHQDKKGAKAYCLPPIRIEDRNFTLGLSVNYDHVNFTVKDIKKSAFHETCEALLHRFHYLADARYCTGEDLREEKHNIIRILESVIFYHDKD